MSFHEIAVTIRAVNRASHEFARVSADAESLATRVRSMGAAVSGLGATTSVIAHLGHQFGLLSDEQSKTLATTSYLITVFGMFLRTTWGVAVAQQVYAAATAIAAKITWVLNAALAMKIALLTLGVGLIVATAAYMAWLASTTRDAAEAQTEYNESLRQRERAGAGRTEEERYEYITRRGY